MMGHCLSQTCFSLFIFSLPINLCILSLSLLFKCTSFCCVAPLSLLSLSCPPSLVSPFPPPFCLHPSFPFIFSLVASPIPQSLFPPRCHLFILPCCLLRFPFILLHLWLFFLSVHRSVFLPPLGGNGKSDISYLVNGERWRERDRHREDDTEDRKMESKDQKSDIGTDSKREKRKTREDKEE